MSPTYGAVTVRLNRFPRVSGDEPAGVDASSLDEGFSPRERG